MSKTIRLYWGKNFREFIFITRRGRSSRSWRPSWWYSDWVTAVYTLHFVCLWWLAFIGILFLLTRF